MEAKENNIKLQGNVNSTTQYLGFTVYTLAQFSNTLQMSMAKTDLF
jgi:hypothetical protein